MRFAEVFAGVGGLSLGLHRAGMDCAFHAEIGAFPRRVLTARFPDVPLYGDVRALSGGRKTAAWMRAKYGGKVDLLAGGSPCQDLSVAGKRAGLAGARSSLFFRQVRLWRVLDCPYFLWENVAGALSSNHGADFAAILSALVGATVAVPADGWGGDESGGGVAAGPRAVAAWRLLDAQYFGVPQRRLRVFVLAARAGGCDPAQVLLEPDRVYGDFAPRREAREGTAGNAQGRVAFAFGSHAGAADGDVTNASHDSGGPVGFGINEEVANALRAGRTQAVADVLSFGWQNSASQGDDFLSEADASLRTSTTAAVLAGSEWDRCAVCNVPRWAHGTEECFHEPAVIINNDSRASVTDVAPPLRAGERAGERAAPSVANCVTARDGKGWEPESAVGNGTVSNGIPRRLMPVECERLMSWPDGWTDVPDERGKPASDAARYKACGNGVVSNVVEWIGARLQDAHHDMLTRSGGAA